MQFNFDSLGILYVVLTPLVLQPFLSCWICPNINDEIVSGYVDQEFSSVEDTFRRNFGEGLESDGAAFVVYHRGKRVVNLWGGYADAESERKWSHDTKTVLFSVTKAMASLVIGVLVDRGVLAYDDLVVDHWPAYGQFGKNGTTIEHVLSHMAGLPYLSEKLEIDDFKSGDFLRKIEQSTPAWEPGTATGYHAMTFGLLVDGIVRHADWKGRDIQTFFKEEIAVPNGLDMSIGMDRREAAFLPRISLPTFWHFFRDTVKNPKMLAMFVLMYGRNDEVLQKVKETPDWLLLNYDTMGLNNPEMVELPMAGATGISSADHLAKLFSMVVQKEIISNVTVGQLMQPTLDSWHYEKVVAWPVMKGHGFFYDKHPIIPGAYTFGHPGYGGQFLLVDPHLDLTFAYVSNGIKTGTGELCATYMRLYREVYAVMQNFYAKTPDTISIFS